MEAKPKRRGRQVLRSLAAAFVLLIVFMLGVNVGSGQISLARHRAPSAGLPGRLNYGSVNQVYQSLKDNYDGKLTEEQLENGLKHGLANSTKDPYTVYFTAKEAKDFNDDLNSTFSGIGAQLGQDKDGNIEIIAPIDGFPAQKAGLLPKDIITTINRQNTSGMSVDEAVSKIRGQAGSKVKLQAVRGHAQPLDFTITRQNIDLPSVKTKTLAGNIGYIQVTTFADDTADLFQKAAQQFKKDNVKGIVLDLRDDPGGLLDSAVKVSSLWLAPGQKILDEKQGSKVVDSQSSQGDDILHGIPTVVLINQGSASASEIVAGALRDNNAAYVIGEKSYGKGVVQQLINFKDGGQLKVTVASWYRPNGQSINHKGVTPDQIVKITPEQAKADQDPQLEAAQTYLNKN